MKTQKWLELLFTVLLIFTCCAGCKSLFATNASPTSAPVLAGVATTNQTVATAYLETAQALNAAIPGPWQPLVTAGISVLSAIAGAAAAKYHSSLTASAPPGAPPATASAPPNAPPGTPRA